MREARTRASNPTLPALPYPKHAAIAEPTKLFSGSWTGLLKGKLLYDAPSLPISVIVGVRGSFISWHVISYTEERHFGVS